MAYTRLNLQDYKDKWTAASVKHLEDGIVENNNSIAALQSQNSTNLGNLLASNILLPRILGNANESKNVGMNMGPATFTFDGDYHNKIHLVANIADDSTGIFSESVCLYVQISDQAISEYTAAYSYGGTIETITGMELLSSLRDNSSQLLEYLPTLMEMEAIRSSYGRMAVLEGDSYYSVLTQEEDFVDVAEYENMIFPHRNLNLPEFFSKDKEFTYNGMTFPKGTYVLCIVGLSSGVELPVYFVNGIWDVMSSATGSTKTKIPFAQLDFENINSHLTFDNNIVKWDGQSLPSSIPHVHLVSLNCSPFVKTLGETSTFMIKYANGESVAAVAEQNYTFGYTLQLANDTQDVAVFVVQNIFYENSTTYWTPGVYFADRDGQKIVEVVCFNSNIEKHAEVKLLDEYYNCLAKEIKQFKAGSKYISNGSNYVSKQYTTTENSVDTTHSFVLIKDSACDTLKNVALITKRRNVTIPSAYMGYHYDYNNSVPSFMTCPKENTYIMSSNNNENLAVFPSSGCVGGSIYITQKGSVTINYKNASLKGTLKISQVRGPSNLNNHPGYRINQSIKDATSGSASFSSIRPGSWIDIEYIPSADEVGQPLSTDFELTVYTGSRENSYYLAIYPHEFQYQLINNGAIEALVVDGQYALLNVIQKTTFNGTTWNEGLYGRIFEDFFISGITYADTISPSVIQKMDRKFLPEVPTFDLTLMGLPMISLSGEEVSVSDIDTSEIRNALEVGSIKCIFMTNVGEASGITNGVQLNGNYQMLFSGYFTVDTKYDVLVIITASQIVARAIAQTGDK